MLKLDDIRIPRGDFAVTAKLQIASGAQVAIIGPSGAGKTTLLEAIAGFVPPDQGRILWQDQDLTDLAPGDRPIAMLFQDGNLFPHLSVLQNVALGMRPNGRLTPTQQAQASAALARVGLSGFEARKPAALSGGQQSRAALARILVQAKPLLLLDEPFAALGPALRHEMLDLVAELASETGATLLMISHDPQDAKRIADQVVFIEGGKAQPPKSTKSFFAKPTKAVSAYLGSITR